MSKRNLDEILDYERCKKRTEKSRYFTEIFFEKYPTKYKELLENYESVDFLKNTVCKYIDNYGFEDYVVIYNLELKNERIEKEYNTITDIIEEMEEDLEDYKNSKFKDSNKDEIEQIEYNLKIIPKIEDMIPIYGESGEKIIRVREDMKEVPRMTIQYNETDWEYLKRLASYTGQPVMPYYDKVLVGFLKNQAVQTPNTTYSQYGKSKKNKRTMYKITGTEVYAVSTPIKLKTRNRAGGEETENDYYVIESRIYNEGNTLKCEYTLGKQTDYFVDPIPHEKIKGAVIEARTVHIARTDESKSNHGRSEGSSDNLEGKTIGAKPLNKYIEKAENQNQNENVKERVKASDIAVMTLDLTEGLLKLGENGQSFEDEYAGKSYFPYVTPYSQTNTGFTPAPETNDRVALYFPSENETHALVMGAVNNDGNGRFTNPDKRNFTLGNSQGGANNGKPMYDFTLSSEKFSMRTGNLINMESSGMINVAGRSNVGVISTTSNVNVIGSKSVNSVVGSSKVTIDPNNVNVNGNSSVDIKGGAKLSATGGQVSIGDGAGTTDIKGGKVKVH